MIDQPPTKDLNPRRGFTLIELLTVIAIIVILIGILLPVVGAVKRAAYQASTQATITQLTAAIEKYRSEFNAYPGPIPNGAFGTNGVAAAAANMTMTENMVVAVVGGWDPVNSYVPASVGLGPMSHNPIASARKRYGAFIDPVEGKNFPQRNGAMAFDVWGPTASPPASGDTAIPEFQDAFPDPLPIIYVRANVGKTGVTGASGSAQYDPAMLVGSAGTGSGTGNYKRPAAGAFKGDFLMNVANDPDDFGSWDEYFRDPNLQTQPRQKDGFWIISAGPDRRFGTRDDQTNFGGFR